MKSFSISDYRGAFNHAVDLANNTKCAAGIQKAWLFSSYVYNVMLLPRKENRFGWELTCEVVEPGTPKTV